MDSCEYSVIVPVFNSEKSLRALFERAEALFAKTGDSFQMVFVDDSSRDNSWQRIVELKSDYPERVKGIRLAHNCGQQKATLCGINNSDGKFIITIDDDLQTPPEEIHKLIALHRETKAELVYGLPDEKRHSPVRNAGSRFFNWFFSKVANTTGRGSSFRLMTAPLAARLRNINQKHLLLDEVLNWFTTSIAYASVEHLKREEGKSNYSFIQLSIMMFNYVVYYTVIPLRLMTYIGLFFSFVSFIVGIGYIYRWLAEDVQPGFTTIIIAIFFSSSVILFSLGIIGEYISRIYVQETSKPPYVIKEIH